MATQTEIISLNILRQREAMFQLKKKVDLTWTDLEILTFSIQKKFFTLYDLQGFYSHTNVQQIRRSLKKLNELKLLKIFSKGVKNNPTFYVVLSAGKDVLKCYTTILLGYQI